MLGGGGGASKCWGGAKHVGGVHELLSIQIYVPISFSLITVFH